MSARTTSGIRAGALPAHALLARYAHDGGYADCYTTEVARPVTHAEYVEAFYTGAVFKLERWLLARFAARPSTDEQARRLAAGTLDAFSAWRVEARAADQLLMCDLTGRTRSWLMVEPVAMGRDAAHTRLYFGSAVVPLRDSRTGLRRMGWQFRALLAFHRMYSRVLLDAARRRVAEPMGGRQR
jgi:hypothetical protein